MGWLEDKAAEEKAFVDKARKMQVTAKEGASPVDEPEIDEVEVEAAQVEPPVLDLSDMTKPQLIEACERRGLATIGNKAELIERLEAT